MSRVAVPKTLWRTNSIAAKFGSATTGLQTPSASYPPTKSMDTVAKVRVLDEEQAGTRGDAGSIAKAMEAYRRQLGVSFGHLSKLQKQGVPFIDVRDNSEMRRVPCPNSVPIHIHDLQSGAAAPILPLDKSAKIVVIGETGGGDVFAARANQRGMNAFNALRHMGYENVTVAEALAALGPKALSQ